MSARSVQHGEFTIERRFAASPRKLFRAWADPQAKRAWSTCQDGMEVIEHRMDFRCGGEEVIVNRGPGGLIHRFHGHYFDIVENQRIVYGFSMDVGEDRLTASLATVQFHADGDGARMVFTEQLAFFDGLQTLEDRREGTQVLFENIALYLHEAPPH